MLPTAAPKPQYQLANHVRACRVDDQVILLDLRKNRYLGVGGPHLQAMSLCIADWPVGTSDVAKTRPSPGLQAWLEKLVEQQMLANPHVCGTPFPQISAATDTLLAPPRAQAPHTDWRRLLELGWSAAVASHWLRRLSLMEIAGRVSSSRAKSQAPCDPTADELRGIVSAYTRMRPFVLTAHDKCLHDSLTLIHFLTQQRLHPRWVIGVRTRPFGAHSWVQSGSVVLNDLHENVRAFTPILVV